MKRPSEYKLIGKGNWTRVYRKEGDENVHMVSTCSVKECMANGWFPMSKFFPEIRYSNLEWFDYESKYFNKVTAPKRVLSPESYATYLMLRDLANTFNRFSTRNDSDMLNDFFENKIQDKELRDALTGALFGLSNYSRDIGFEISPRNIASDNGQLVLLDCFFIREYK